MSDFNAAGRAPSSDSSAVGARRFVDRHIGPDESAIAEMLKVVGFDSLDELMDAAVPGRIKAADGLSLPAAATEAQAAAELRALAALNRPAEPMIGLGYHGTITPAVIRRNVLEDPAWYTAYTPYQPEISQGRLEALLNFQTVVADLTGLPTANASLLDEGTAAAEAMTLVRRAAGASRTGTGSGPFVVDADALPQTIAVVRTRATAMGIDVVVADLTDGLPDGELSGVLVQYPGASGRIVDPRPVIEAAHERGGLAVVAADLLALTLLEAPGTWGADVVVGSSQRFGVPLFHGGPHAGFMSVRSGLERHLPGRLVGVSVDSAGRQAYRLSLQTREQHIRRDKATSNICTAQVLLAVVASMYAVYHGPDGLRRIALQVHRNAGRIADTLRAGGVDVVHDAFFDTVLTRVPGRAAEIVAAARERGIHLRLVDADLVGISVGETADDAALESVLAAFGVSTGSTSGGASSIPEALARTTDFLSHPVFSSHRSETSMLRYLRRLSARDYALDRGMIPLGSCTMKLNATTEMEPMSLPGFADLHPFAPAEDAQGYQRLVADLEGWLAEVTGYDRVSIQPNAGSQGELAGLLAIRGYHHARGDEQREVCLIPSSAHGTNAASAVMAGMKVVVVKSADDGAVDLDDLRAQCEAHADDLAAIMVTYPSTHGAYEDTISDLCAIVHEHGGQVYVDGANLNALLGYARPGQFGGDVSHLNLHKTFCIPHGGGGPGVGPIGVREHLAPYLPSHPMHPEVEKREGIGPISAAPYGSAGILPISWAYVRMMGAEGLTRATAVAVLAANYVAARLGEHFPVLYRGHNDLVAHECILDVRGLSKADRCQHRRRRQAVDRLRLPRTDDELPGRGHADGRAHRERGPRRARSLLRGDDRRSAARSRRSPRGSGAPTTRPLRGAPHTADALNHELSYDLATAVFPTGFDPDKYWPPVGRIDQAYGDRNLVCSCPPPEAFA